MNVWNDKNAKIRMKILAIKDSLRNKEYPHQMNDARHKLWLQYYEVVNVLNEEWHK